MRSNSELHGRWRPAHAALLQQLPLFAETPEERIRTLAELARWRSYHHRAAILAPGEGKGYVFLLADGRARVYGMTFAGAELSIFFLPRGSVVDLNDLPARLSHVVHVEALEESLVVRLPREPFLQAAFATPDAIVQLNAQARQQLMENGLLLWEVVSQDVVTRLQHELARLAEQSPELMVWATHEELAQRIGASREEITRLLPGLRQRGLIAYEPHHRGIRILHLALLADAGGEDGRM